MNRNKSGRRSTRYLSTQTCQCLMALVVGVVVWGIGGLRAAAEDEGDKAEYTIHPIGRVHNKKGEPVQLKISKEYLAGLHRLDLCSHVTVVWWFHQNDTPEKRKVLSVHPRGNKENPLTGVFATHSPVRPNLIAITTCKILSVKDGVVTVEGIDAFDGTPIIDLKSAGSRKEPLK